MATTIHLLPKPASFLLGRSSPPIPSAHFVSPHLSPLQRPIRSRRPDFSANLKKKNQWLDPFDDGADPEMEYGSLFADGKQEEDPRPPDDPGNPYGFLKFPAGYNVEVASLGLKVRGDVRRCCCVVSGGVYENLLFFPLIQLLKNRYPGVQVDVIASPRGKQTYELNKNVRWANVYDLDDDFPEPAEYTDMVGVIKVDASSSSEGPIFRTLPLVLRLQCFQPYFLSLIGLCGVQDCNCPPLDQISSRFLVRF